MQTACKLDFDYLPDAPDVAKIPLQDFVGTSWIPDEQSNLWLSNYRANRDRLKIFPQSDIEGKACVMVGSSPAVKRNFHHLKNLGEDFLIIACNGVAKFLVENGIRPDYIFLVEARNHILKDFDFDTKGLTLIISPFAPTGIFHAFQGEIWTYLLGGGEKVNEEIKQDFFEPIEIGGGNVISTSILWAYKFLRARFFILTGMSLCYYDDYYFDGRTTQFVGQNLEECRNKYEAIDIYGDPVSTTPALSMYKAWLETYLKYATGATFVNATEDGILGVNPEIVSYEEGEYRYNIKYLEWINIAPLDVAIEGFGRFRDGINRNGLREEMSAV